MSEEEFRDSDDQLGALEAVLFVSSEAVNAVTLADILGVDTQRVQELLETLQDRLTARDSGIQLREIAGGWRLFTHPRYHDMIEKYVVSWDTRKLSTAALETLSVIAYNQPVTKNAIMSVRGVNSDSAINSLIEKGLVKEAGHEKSPGSPILYATTRSFLERFGLKSVSELPPLEDFAPDEESRRLIAQRLGIAHVDDSMIAVEYADNALFEMDAEGNIIHSGQQDSSADSPIVDGIQDVLLSMGVNESVDLANDPLTAGLFGDAEEDDA